MYLDQNTKERRYFKCDICSRPLHVFGRPRKNGVTHHDDWVGRLMHKRCYKELLKIDLFDAEDLSMLQPSPLDERQRTLLLNPLRLTPLKQEQEPEPELVKELKPDREKTDVASSN
jgi:hypothetical protein